MACHKGGLLHDWNGFHILSAFGVTKCECGWLYFLGIGEVGAYLYTYLTCYPTHLYNYRGTAPMHLTQNKAEGPWEGSGN